MNLQLDDNEVQFIVNVLGELPSKTGAFMLMQKIQMQASTPTPSSPPPDMQLAKKEPDLKLAEGVNA